MTNSLQEELRKYRDEREWGDFHNLRSLVIALMVEAVEVFDELEFLDDGQIDFDIARLSFELADVYMYLFFLADQLEYELDEDELVALWHDQQENRLPIQKLMQNLIASTANFPKPLIWLENYGGTEGQKDELRKMIEPIYEDLLNIAGFLRINLRIFVWEKFRINQERISVEQGLVEAKNLREMNELAD